MCVGGVRCVWEDACMCVGRVRRVREDACRWCVDGVKCVWEDTCRCVGGLMSVGMVYADLWMGSTLRQNRVYQRPWSTPNAGNKWRPYNMHVI